MEKVVVVKVLSTLDSIGESNKKFKFLGTAFFVDNETLITAKHVIFNDYVSTEERIYISEVPSGGDIAIQETSIIKCESDIAILKLNQPMEGVEKVTFSTLALKMKQEIEIQGYTALSTAKEIKMHTISSMYNEYYALKLQGATQNGFSGSPILIDGKICGVAHASDVYSTYIIPISEVCDKSILNTIDEEGEVAQNPYKGLNSFTYRDKHNFYGREKESKEIAESLKDTRLYTLLGASGSGKSSLVFAGIKPLLENDDITIIDFRPREDVFKSLALVLIPLLYSDKLEQIEQSEKLTNKLISDEIKLDNLVETLLGESKVKKIYLIIDQFEEIFTLTKEQDIREKFLNQLLTFINSDLAITVLIVMRTDFLAQFSYYESFNNVYNKYSNKNLTQLSREQLEKVIVEPAKSLGVTFQDGLVERIVEEVENRVGQLPVLEFALEQLWNKKRGKVITHEVLDIIGGVTHAISNHAEKIYTSNKERQESIKKVFMKLVNPTSTIGETSNAYDTRRVASFDEFDEEEIKTIRVLATNRLVVTKEITNEEDGTKRVVDIIHEALIREWDRLKDWIVEYRDFLLWQEQLEKDRVFYIESGSKSEDLLIESKLLKAKEFFKSHREYISPLDRDFIEINLEEERRKKREKKRKKRNRNLLIIGGFLLLLGGIGVSGYYWKKAEDKKNEIEELYFDSKIQEGINGLKNNPLKSKLLFSKVIQNKNIDDNQEKKLKILYDSINTNVKLESIIEVGSVPSEVILDKEEKEVYIWNNSGMVKSFDIKSAKELWSLSLGSPLNVVFKKDRKKIISWNKRKRIIQVIDTKTKKMICSYPYKNILRGLKLSKDNKHIIFWDNWETIKYLNINTCQEEFNLKLNTKAENIKFSNDENKILLLNRYTNSYLYNKETNKTKLFDSEILIKGVIFSSDNKYLLRWKKEIALLRDENLTQVHKFNHHVSIEKASFDKENKKVLTWSKKGVIKVWNIEDGKEIFTVKHLNIRGVKFINKNQILSWSRKGVIQIWDIPKKKKLFELKLYQSILGLNFTKEKNYLYSWGRDGNIKFWKINYKKRFSEFKSLQMIDGLKFIKGVNKILTWNRRGLVTLWDTKTNQKRDILKNDGYIWDIVLSKNRKEILVCTEDGKVIHYDIEKDKWQGIIQHKGLVYGASFDKNNKKVISWGDDKKVKLWDKKTNSVETILYYKTSISRAFFTKNGTKVISLGANGSYKVWDIKTKNEKNLLNTNHSINILSNKFDKDKNLIITWSRNGQGYLFDIETNKEEMIFKHKGSVNGVQINKDKTKILSWGHDGYIRLWDRKENKELFALEQKNPISQAVFSKNEKIILSCDDGGNVILWDMEKKQKIITLRYENMIIGVKFSEDEQRILSWDHNGVIHIYDLYLTKNLNPKQYLLKIEVETGKYLSPSGEVKSLTQKEWIKKREELKKVNHEKK